MPPPTGDGPAWFIAEDGTSKQQVDFDTMAGTVPGGIPVGGSRSAGLLVYNVSKKTPLTIASASLAGVNSSDFSLIPADVSAALAASIPPNQSAFVRIGVSFTPWSRGAARRVGGAQRRAPSSPPCPDR